MQHQCYFQLYFTENLLLHLIYIIKIDYALDSSHIASYLHDIHLYILEKTVAVILTETEMHIIINCKLNLASNIAHRKC